MSSLCHDPVSQTNSDFLIMPIFSIPQHVCTLVYSVVYSLIKFLFVCQKPFLAEHTIRDRKEQKQLHAHACVFDICLQSNSLKSYSWLVCHVLDHEKTSSVFKRRENILSCSHTFACCTLLTNKIHLIALNS